MLEIIVLILLVLGTAGLFGLHQWLRNGERDD